MENIIKPKQPKGAGWQFIRPYDESENFGYGGEVWRYPQQRLQVITAVEVASHAENIELGPEYHVSASKYPNQRCTRNEARFVLKAFDMLDADEDNHVPGGFVRNFWLPVAEKYRGFVCPCKDTETAFKENKGDFIWRGFEK